MMSFREVASMLVDKISEAQSLPQIARDERQVAAVFPFIFLSRHAIELQLKEAIYSLEEDSAKTRTHHDVGRLAKELHDLLLSKDRTFEAARFSPCLPFLELLGSQDPQGILGKYAIDKQKKILLSGYDAVNLGDFRDNCNFVHVTLDDLFPDLTRPT